MSISVREFDLVINKFGFRTRETHHLLAWFEYDGKVVARTRRSRTPRSRDLPAQHSIRQQMKLSADEFRQAVRCRINRNDYIEILRKKGVIEDNDGE